MPDTPPPDDDPVLARLRAEVPLPRVESTGAVFHDLMSCLVEQQIHYRSTKGTFQNLLDRAGVERVTPETFARFERDGLAHASLSHRKREALAAAAAFFADDATDWAALPDAEVRKTLGAIRGVGPWTVDMVLLYTLGRPDVFPVDDYHLKQVMRHHYGLAEAGLRAAMRATAEAWRPHRSTGVRLLLGWKDWQREVSR